MSGRDASFLRRYLEEVPEFQSVVRGDPPQALWEGRWLPVLQARPLKTGALLTLSGGRKLRLTPAQAGAAVRDPCRQAILKMLRHRFPRHRFERVLTGTDRVRRQPASILRVLLCQGGRRLAVLAAYPGSPPSLADRVFSSLVLWWEALSPGREPQEALLLIPEEWSQRLVDRFPFLAIPLVCCKYGLASDGKIATRQIYPAPPDQTRVGSPYVLFPRRRRVPRILAAVARQAQDLDLTLRHGAWELSFRGLPVAWQQRESGACLFDLLNPAPLADADRPRLELHLNAVRRLRRFPSPDPGHPHFRLKPERWLESSLLRDPRAVDPDFSGAIYSQVPTCVDGDRKVLDLLTLTRNGRLAVVELKVEKDLGLIFQALDYWERVSVHLSQGDFQRRGYFPGRRLSPQSPLLYLVSPLFEFHRAMPALRKRLRPRVQFRCVGVNSDWRRGLKVLRRFEF